METKKAAYSLICEICRIPTHLFMFIKYCEQESAGSEGTIGPTGWGRAHKRAINRWYLEKKPEQLARLVTKFKNREGWTHKDVLRLSHTHTRDRALGFILRYIIKGLDKACEMYAKDNVPDDVATIVDLVKNIDHAMQITDAPTLCGAIKQYKLTWEQCPSQLLQDSDVWFALLDHMPVEAMIRNLGRMTGLGLFKPDSESETMVLAKIASINSLITKEPTEEPVQEVEGMEVDGEESEAPPTNGKRRNLLHPFKILIALEIYRDVKNVERKGKTTWEPNKKIVKALDEAFYAAFEQIEPTGKKYYLGVDVSGSMGTPVLGSSSIYCSTAAAAMMMVTARTEKNCIIKGFSNSMRDLMIKDTDMLGDVQRKVNSMTFGSTDCAAPMLDAMENKIKDIDVFIIYTDCETWIGRIHPSEALRNYRKYAETDPMRPKGKPGAKLIVCGMTSSEFTIADPDDTGMLDIAGFDSSAPKVISEFALGNI